MANHFLDINPIFIKRSKFPIIFALLLIWLIGLSLVPFIFASKYIHIIAKFPLSIFVIAGLLFYSWKFTIETVNCKIHDGKFHFSGLFFTHIIDLDDIVSIEEEFKEYGRSHLSIRYKLGNKKRKANFSCRRDLKGQEIDPKKLIQNVFNIESADY